MCVFITPKTVVEKTTLFGVNQVFKVLKSDKSKYKFHYRKIGLDMW